MKTAALTLLAYIVVAIIAFGDPLSPLGLLLVFSDRLGAPHWELMAAAGTMLAGTVFLVPKRHGHFAPYRLPAFVALSMTISIVSVGLYTDSIRRERTAEFNADVSFQRSFFKSIREAPREFQFYLHGAALKDCVPYAWSYRTMGFYELPPNVAVNVLPNEWLTRCSIVRTDPA